MLRKKILVTDDDQEICDLLVSSLQTALPTCDFIGTTSLYEAIKILKAQQLDLGVIGFNMRKPIGRDFVSEMQELVPEFPYILISPYLNYEIGTLGQSAKGLVSKPIDTSLLLTEIRKSLDIKI